MEAAMYKWLTSFSLSVQPPRRVSLARRLAGGVPTARLRLLGRSLLLTACLGAAAPAMMAAAKAATPECPGHQDCGQHNMMIVGEQAIFLSHLPMFGNEHRFQVILEVAFDQDGTPLDNVYADDRRKHPSERMYTLEPHREAPFVLARLFNGDSETLMRSFPATVYRGHLERGGEPLEQLTDIEVTVQRVVYAEEIGLPADQPLPDGLDYIVFGGAPELFLAHRIAGPPNFDQLLGVKLSGHEFTEEDFARGISITVSDRENSPARRLRVGEIVAAQGHVAGTDAMRPVEVEVTTEYYFEESELDPDSSDPLGQTPLEEEAGF